MSRAALTLTVSYASDKSTTRQTSDGTFLLREQKIPRRKCFELFFPVTDANFTNHITVQCNFVWRLSGNAFGESLGRVIVKIDIVEIVFSEQLVKHGDGRHEATKKTAILRRLLGNGSSGTVKIFAWGFLV